MRKRTGAFPGVREEKPTPVREPPRRARAYHCTATGKATGNCKASIQKEKIHGRASEHTPIEDDTIQPGANSWRTYAYPYHVRLRGAQTRTDRASKLRQANSNWCIRAGTRKQQTPARVKRPLKAWGVQLADMRCI